MRVVLDKVERIRPGTATVLRSESTGQSAAVVFEDDGETGYFYACAVEGPIYDALHVYTVATVADRHRPSTLEIGWSSTGRQAVLLINNQPHAVFDFDRSKGWCRAGVPPSNGSWSLDGHEWDDACLDYFR